MGHHLKSGRSYQTPVVAFRSAGIETPVSLAVVEDQDLVPEDRWLMDEARLDWAIRTAIGAGGDGLRRNGRP